MEAGPVRASDLPSRTAQAPPLFRWQIQAIALIAELRHKSGPAAHKARGCQPPMGRQRPPVRAWPLTKFRIFLRAVRDLHPPPPPPQPHQPSTPSTSTANKHPPHRPTSGPAWPQAPLWGRGTAGVPHAAAAQSEAAACAQAPCRGPAGRHEGGVQGIGAGEGMSNPASTAHIQTAAVAARSRPLQPPQQQQQRQLVNPTIACSPYTSSPASAAPPGCSRSG